MYWPWFYSSHDGATDSLWLLHRFRQPSITWATSSRSSSSWALLWILRWVQSFDLYILPISRCWLDLSPICPLPIAWPYHKLAIFSLDSQTSCSDGLSTYCLWSILPTFHSYLPPESWCLGSGTPLNIWCSLWTIYRGIQWQLQECFGYSPTICWLHQHLLQF